MKIIKVPKTKKDILEFLEQEVCKIKRSVRAMIRRKGLADVMWCDNFIIDQKEKAIHYDYFNGSKAINIDIALEDLLIRDRGIELDRRRRRANKK